MTVQAPAEAQVAARRLLITDDDDAVRVALSFILRREGFEVFEAADGRQCLDQVAEQQVDVILLDLSMPVMDGERTLAMLRRDARGRRIPVIILTQHADRDRVARCGALRISGYLLKRRLDVNKLIATVRNVAVAADEQTDRPENDGAGGGASLEPVGARGRAVDPDDGPVDINDLLGFDQAAWKKQVAELGRVSKDEATAACAGPPSLIMPDVAGELSNALSDTNSEIPDFVELVHQEPMLLIKVLAAANQSQDEDAKATDATTALQWIGRRGLVDLMRDAARHVDRDKATRPWLQRWWLHSVAVGRLAGVLAEPMGLAVGEATAAAMLHDVGRLRLLTAPFGESVRQCFDLTRNMAIRTAHAEQMLLGISHEQAGRQWCHTLCVPTVIADACELHGAEDAALERMDKRRAALASVVGAANQLAKVFGFSSLPNDEIAAIPAMAVETVAARRAELEAAAAEVQTIAAWRLGGAAPERFSGELRLNGLSVVVVSPRPEAANPFIRLLRQLGAIVHAYLDYEQLQREAPSCELVLVDLTAGSVGAWARILSRYNHDDRLAGVPRLVLARRSEDAPVVLAQRTINWPVFPTPIRVAALAQVVHRLVGLHVEANP